MQVGLWQNYISGRPDRAQSPLLQAKTFHVCHPAHTPVQALTAALPLKVSGHLLAIQAGAPDCPRSGMSGDLGIAYHK